MDRHDITGLVLAGGRGSRMGGVDKGLVWHQGRPLAEHAVTRLAPQVGTVMVSANRHLDRYEAMGVSAVLPDGGAVGAFEGPLAGVLAGLLRCETPWLATVPCDSPYFPDNLVLRLSQALETEGAQLSMAAIRQGAVTHPQPVFCLLHRDLAHSLKAFLASGQGKSGLWASGLRRALVVFDDAAAFTNVNTGEELAALQRP